MRVAHFYEVHTHEEVRVNADRVDFWVKNQAGGTDIVTGGRTVTVQADVADVQNELTSCSDV